MDQPQFCEDELESRGRFAVERLVPTLTDPAGALTKSETVSKAFTT